MAYLKKTPLFLTFILSCLFLVIGTVFFPFIRFWSFSPFIAVFLYRTSFLKGLWLGFLSGLCMDLFSSQFPFGFFSATHSLTVCLLFKQKRHFFEDKMLSFSLFAALISCVLSLFLLILNPMLGNLIQPSFLTYISDLIIMPIVDGFYAFFGFVFPSYLYATLKKYAFQRHLLKEDL